MENTNVSVCGTDCGSCEFLGKMCSGCNACEGKVFHAPEGKACRIYECVRNSRGLLDCGLCGEAPCPIWMETRDPGFSDEQFKENITVRLQMLKNRGDYAGQ